MAPAPGPRVCAFVTPLERDAELALPRTWLAEAGAGRGRLSRFRFDRGWR